MHCCSTNLGQCSRAVCDTCTVGLQAPGRLNDVQETPATEGSHKARLEPITDHSREYFSFDVEGSRMVRTIPSYLVVRTYDVHCNPQNDSQCNTTRQPTVEENSARTYSKSVDRWSKIRQLGQSSRVVDGAAAEDSVMAATALAACTDLLEGCARNTRVEPLQASKLPLPKSVRNR